MDLFTLLAAIAILIIQIKLTLAIFAIRNNTAETKDLLAALVRYARAAEARQASPAAIHDGANVVE